MRERDTHTQMKKKIAGQAIDDLNGFDLKGRFAERASVELI